MSATIWFILMAITLSWYLIVTIIVAIRGAKDIKKLIKENA